MSEKKKWHCTICGKCIDPNDYYINLPLLMCSQCGKPMYEADKKRNDIFNKAIRGWFDKLEESIERHKHEL